MIQLKRINYIWPELRASLRDHATQEISSCDADIEKVFANPNSEVWLIQDGIEPCGIFGIYQRSYLGDSPWFWFLACKGFNPFRHIKYCRKWMVEFFPRFPDAKTYVDPEFDHGVRFAQLCYWLPVDHFVEIDGKRYQTYKVNKSWLSYLSSSALSAQQ